MAAIPDDRNTNSYPASWTVAGNVNVDDGFILQNANAGQSEITFDYGQAVGGMPFIQTKAVASNGGPVEVDVIFSETFKGLQKETGTCHISSDSDKTNRDQAMVLSFYFQMPWIHTDSIINSSSPPQPLISRNYHLRKDPNDTRDSFFERPIPQYQSPPSATHIFAHQTPL